MYAKVEGGTGAGSKRPLRAASSWTCSCPAPANHTELFANREHPSWRTRCDGCGMSKP